MPVDNADNADNAEMQGNGGGALRVAIHPDYIILWAESTRYYVGERRPLKWNIVRKDNGLVDVPSAGDVKILRPDNTIDDAGSPDLESGIPAATCVAAAIYQFSVPGQYIASITLTIDEQIIEQETILWVVP